MQHFQQAFQQVFLYSQRIIGYQLSMAADLYIIGESRSGSKMNITIVEESNLTAWEASLSNTHANPFLSTPWLESFRNSKCTPLYFRFISEGTTLGLAGGLSLEPFHSRLGKIFRKLFLFTGPVFLQSDPELEKICLAKMLDYAISNKYTHLEIRAYDYPRPLEFGELPFIKEKKEEYIIDLYAEWSDIEKKMRKTIVQQVKFAQKKGLSFHESHSPELIGDLIGFLEQTQERRLSKGYEKYAYLYMPYIKKDILYRLFEKKAGRLFFVRAEDRVISISFTVVHDHKSYALLIGSIKEAYALRAPVFNWYNMIKKLKDEGFYSINLGGVPQDSSKEKMAFAKISYGAEKFLCSGVKTSHLNGRLFNLMNVLYTKMPDTRIKKVISRALSGRSV